MLACSPGPFSPHPTDSWFGPQSGMGTQGSWLLRSPYFASSSLSPPPHLDPKGHSANFPQRGQGSWGWKEQEVGAVRELPLDSRARRSSPHKQMFPMNHPALKGRSSWGLAGAEVTVNYFPAAPPPSATTLTKIPDPKSRREWISR